MARLGWSGVSQMHATCSLRRGRLVHREPGAIADRVRPMVRRWPARLAYGLGTALVVGLAAWVFLSAVLSRSAVQAARAQCVELGHPGDGLEFAHYDWMGGLLGESDAIVDFRAPTAEGPRLLSIRLRRPSCLHAWSVIEWETTEIHEPDDGVDLPDLESSGSHPADAA